MESRFETAVEFGQKIVENGGEISRAEETVKRLCLSLGAKNIHVFIIPSLISVSAEIDGKAITTTRRIYKNDLNLGELEAINNTSRKLCGDKSTGRNIDFQYPVPFTILCVMLATGAFCLYFGGSFTDALFSGFSGIIITYLPYNRSSFNSFSCTLIEATTAGILSFIPYLAGLDCHPDKITIGTIMLLIPGMSIGASMKDIMSGNLIAGLLQLAEAIILALAIALGFSIALLIFGGNYAA